MKRPFCFLKTITGFWLLLWTLSISSSCSEDDSDEPAIFLWNQTGCADPWNTGPTDSDEDTTQAVEAYLSENGIGNVSNISIEFDESVATDCFACSCTTGTVIYIETTEIDSSKMEDLGFVRNL